MLDIKFIRQNPDLVKAGLKKRQVNVDIDKIINLDKTKREILRELDDLRSQRNIISKKVSLIITDEEKEKARLLKEKIKQKEIELNNIESELNKLLFQLPNLPLDEVPEGENEKDNVVVKEVGSKPKFGFEPKSYLEISQRHNLIDIERASKISGSRFGILKNEAVFLEFAIINFTFDFLVKKGFIPVIPPTMIKEEMMKAMGYVDTESDLAERYYLEKDKLFLVGTAEQSIGPMHKDEIFDEKELPKRYIGFSSCFREEAGSYGKDTKGILRVHQFDKIEMFSFCHPEQSKKEHLFFLQMEEGLMKQLKLPYRVVSLCSADLARPSAATYDIETYLPSENLYRETHSTSNCTDFQARRLNIRFREKAGKISYIHTLNGTAFAIGRIIIAILENYQRKDGKVGVPKVLQKYLGFKTIPRR